MLGRLVGVVFVNFGCIKRAFDSSEKRNPRERKNVEKNSNYFRNLEVRSSDYVYAARIRSFHTFYDHSRCCGGSLGLFFVNFGCLKRMWEPSEKGNVRTKIQIVWEFGGMELGLCL